MVGVLIGFAIIAAVIAAGYLVGRSRILGDGAETVVSRLAFFVLMPPLLFTVLAQADLEVLFSDLLPVSAIVAVLNFAIFAVVALVVWKRKVPETVVGALGSGYVNASNIGLPVSLYMLGDASTSAPIILLQLVIISPVVLTLLDVTTSGRVSIGRILMQPIRNPVVIASILGVAVAALPVEIPGEILELFELVGHAGVPVVLLAFGMSLHGSRVLAAGTDRRGVVLASLLKAFLMPVAAWVVGRFLFGLDGQALFAVVALAALPAAQNVFVYAQRYARGVVLARDIVLLTTALSGPVLVVVAALLAP